MPKPDQEELLKAEISRLQAWVNDLQSGTYINCVYCGHRYGPDPETPVAFAEILKEHIAQCEKHPMAHLAKACLSGYYLCCSLLAVREDPTDELIAECRDALKEALEKAGGPV